MMRPLSGIGGVLPGRAPSAACSMSRFSEPAPVSVMAEPSSRGLFHSALMEKPAPTFMPREVFFEVGLAFDAPLLEPTAIAVPLSPPPSPRAVPKSSLPMSATVAAFAPRGPVNSTDEPDRTSGRPSPL